jgi:hypothetical protein
MEVVMARLLGHTQRRINLGFWAALVVVVALLGGAASWLIAIAMKALGS